MKQKTLGEYESGGGERYKDPDWLRQKYCGEGLTTHEMAELVPVTFGSICYHMKKHGIEFRSASERFSGERNPMHGKTRSEETRKTISEKLSGRTISDERREAMSECLSGEDNPRYGTTLSEETKRKISDTLTGRTLSEEHRRHVSEGYNGGPKGRICVVPTKHTVRSGWECEIDLLLHDAGFDFEYEPKRFKIGDGRHYTPDFRVGDNIIEVKGMPYGDGEERAELFMAAYPEYQYIVVGTELPADVWIPWAERESLLDELDTG